MLPIQILEDEDVVENSVDQRTPTTKYTEKAIDFINEQVDLTKGHPDVVSALQEKCKAFLDSLE